MQFSLLSVKKVFSYIELTIAGFNVKGKFELKPIPKIHLDNVCCDLIQITPIYPEVTVFY